MEDINKLEKTYTGKFLNLANPLVDPYIQSKKEKSKVPTFFLQKDPSKGTWHYANITEDCGALHTRS